MSSKQQSPADAPEVTTSTTPTVSETGLWNRLTKEHPAVWGTGLTMLSAIFYSGANVALRSVARPDDFDWSIWVTANKGVCAAVIAFTICCVQTLRGRPGFPPLRIVPLLLIAGAMTQYLGNLSFQYALSVGGLALTVPLTFATLITTGAILGRIVLGEPLTKPLAAAMAVLIFAIIILSQGAAEASASVTGDPGTMTKALLAGCLAGLGYGSVGVIIRQARQQNLSVAATLVYISSSGVIGLTLISLWRVGFDRMIATPPTDYGWMMLASLCNAGAFFSVAAAYGLLPVTRVNLVNTSQAAIGGAAGVLFFQEALTGWLVAGTLITILGLLLTSIPTKRSAVSNHD